MPASLVQSMADKTGKSVDKVEKLWNKAKEIAKKEYSDIPVDSDKYYAVVVGILKKMLGIKEEDGTITTTNIGNMGAGPVMQMYKRQVKKKKRDGSCVKEEDEKKKKKIKPVVIYDPPLGNASGTSSTEEVKKKKKKIPKHDDGMAGSQADFAAMM